MTLEDGRRRLVTAVQTAVTNGYRLVDTTLFSGPGGFVIWCFRGKVEKVTGKKHDIFFPVGVLWAAFLSMPNTQNSRSNSSKVLVMHHQQVWRGQFSKEFTSLELSDQR